MAANTELNWLNVHGIHIGMAMLYLKVHPSRTQDVEEKNKTKQPGTA